MNIASIAWQEKYRPIIVDNIIGDHTNKIKNYISNFDSMPNILLVSRQPGTGKTTTAKAIINEVKTDALMLNASDERGIDTIREKVKNFSITMGLQGKRKIIFLDEMDNLTKDAQMSLRAMMEDYTKNVVFILSCNYINKVIEPLVSRCVTINLSLPKKEGIYQYLEDICKKENLQYENTGLNVLIQQYYPSIRNMVNVLQDLHNENKSVTIDNVSKSNNNEFIDYLKQGNYDAIRIKLFKQEYDAVELNRTLWHYINTSNFDSSKKISLIKLLANNERDFSTSADKNIVFCSIIPNLIEVFK